MSDTKLWISAPPLVDEAFVLIVRAVYLDNKKETGWYQHSVSTKEDKTMKENYRNIMEQAPNTDHSARYTVIGYPQDGGNPVIKMTDDRDYAIRLYRQAKAFNGRGKIYDNTGVAVKLPSFAVDNNTKNSVKQAPAIPYYRDNHPVKRDHLPYSELYMLAEDGDEDAREVLRRYGWGLKD